MGVLAGLRARRCLAAFKRTHRAIRQDGPVKLRQCWNSARGRLAKLDRGEEVPDGLSRPMEIEAVLRTEGWRRADFRRMDRFGEISKHEFETKLFPRVHEASKRAERAVINAVWRETARLRR
jgi:hypothetical protein